MGVHVPRGKLLGMKSLVANRLYDAEGNPVGKLEESVLDVRTGCVRHVVVAVEVLGIGRRRFAVP
jgi:sporulation protein YlmC with PRC-barrel domain